MTQGQCRECKAQYESERELRDHMSIADRKFGSAQIKAERRDSRANGFVAQAPKGQASSFEE
jgi:hypothetical protein